MFSVFHTSSTYVTISSRQIGSFFGYTKIMAGVWRYSTKRTLGIHVVPKAYLYLACVYHRAQLFRTKCWEILTRAPSQYPKRRLFVRSRKVSKPRDWYFKLSYRFEILQAHRQHCCRSACQISERSANSKYKSRGFETLRDLTERRFFGYWDGAQDTSVTSFDTVLYCIFKHIDMECTWM